MNFLGHLFFSRNNTELMTANLFGDFVKGKDLTHFSPTTQQGIFLHRSIDSYIDQHPVVIDLLHNLYTPLPKIAGIAVDLYFDHLLAKKWSNYHHQKLADFIENFYTSINLKKTEYTSEFILVMEKMIEKNWLYQYQFKHGLYKASQGVSNRLSFKNELVNAVSVFDEYETSIERAFEEFMAQAIPHFDKLILPSF